MGGLFAWSETLAESETVNGVGELWLRIPFTCQWSARARTEACACFDNRTSYVPLATARWRASNNDAPRSAARLKGFCARSFSPESGFAAAPDKFIAER